MTPFHEELSRADLDRLLRVVAVLSDAAYSASVNLEHLREPGSYENADANGPKLIAAIIDELDEARAKADAIVGEG